MSTPHPDYDRLQELLADRALFGVSAVEQRELEKLLAAMPEVDESELDRLAAAVQLGTFTEQATLPPELAEKIKTQATRSEPFVKTRAQVVAINRREMLAWLACAASLMLAAFLVWRSSRDALSPSQLLAELNRDPQAITVAWSAGPDETGKSATGDIVWSNRQQEGVMSFRGLPPNDPKKSQYQLWIFDTAQDEKYPVDGGVFDIPPGQNEVLVPIHAKLEIVDPTMFAITIEKPGGVVVSSRERLPLLARVAR
jgi:hypothetical protein